MKKLICLVAVLLSITACDDSVEVINVSDLMGLTNTADLEDAAGSADDNYGSYFTSKHYANITAGETLALTASRNSYVADRKYGTQKATINIVSSSTARQGTDFDISTTSLRFKKGVYSLPVSVTTTPSAKGKTIILRLDYGYTDVSPKEGRKYDTFTINVD